MLHDIYPNIKSITQFIIDKIENIHQLFLGNEEKIFQNLNKTDQLKVFNEKSLQKINKNEDSFIILEQEQNEFQVKGDIFNHPHFMCLIRLVKDCQEGTHFSKLIVCEDSFIKLLNIFDEENNKYELSQDRKQTINFSKFEKKPIFTGLYGSQETINSYLKTKSIYIFEEFKKLETGIYLYQESSDNFYLICWNENIYNKIDPAFRNINVSLMRYIYELCNNFVILLNKNEEETINKDYSFNDFLKIDEIQKDIGIIEKKAEPYKIQNLGKNKMFSFLKERQSLSQKIKDLEKFHSAFIAKDSKCFH